MASELQEALLHAIDTVISNRVGQLAVDKTVTATVEKCADNLNGRYALKYQGGILYGYATDGSVYTNGQSVYLLIPENDMSKKKVILGLADVVELEQPLFQVSEIIDEYNKIGANFAAPGVYGLDADHVKSHLPITVAHSTVIKNAAALYIGGYFNTANLRTQNGRYDTKKGEYGIIVRLNEVDTEQYVVYVLESSGMNGSPNNYRSNTHQYNVYPLNPNKTYVVDGVEFFCQNYVQNNSDSTIGDLEIFVQNIEIYPLQTLPSGASSGDYSLYYLTPNGNTFKHKTASLGDTLEVKAILKQSGVAITDQAKYYWFRKDGTVTKDNAEHYLAEGGEGWCYLDEHSGSTFYTKAITNTAYENIYKVVCVLQDNVVLASEFSIFNPNSAVEIQIESQSGTMFSLDNGTFSLVCRVKPEDVDYTYTWTRKDGDGTTINISDLYNKKNSSETYDTLTENLLNKIKGVVINGNTIEHDVALIQNGSSVFTCEVFDKRRNSIGSASIEIFNNDYISPTEDYHIEILNKDQVFKYSASGVSPTSVREQTPQKILPLECVFYAPTGDVIDPEFYKIEWSAPEAESMIEKIKVDSSVCEVFILETYSPELTNNQISVKVSYEERDFRASTNFVFTKDGNPGTNGTDYVIKITKENGEYVGILYFGNQEITRTNAEKYNDFLMRVAINYNDKMYYAYEPYVTINEDYSELIEVIDEFTLKYVMYDLSGKNPQYNTATGIGIRFSDDLDLSNIKIETSGSNLFLDESSNLLYNKPNEEGVYFIKVIPSATFSEEQENNYIVIRNKEQEIATVPIYMYLNRYGVESLNGWDGQKVLINNNGEYIFAPQIGAGYKDKDDNTFTGVVMGTLVESNTKTTGLFGFDKGARTFCINAEENGISTIGGWKIDTNQLSNVSTKEKDFTGEASGIILRADDESSIISVKSAPVIDDSNGINIFDSNSQVRYGESFEAELNPGDPSVFSVYLHSPLISVTPGEGSSDTEIYVDGKLISSFDSNTNKWTTGEKYNGYYVLPVDPDGDITKRVYAKFIDVPNDQEEILSQAAYTRVKRFGINNEGNFYVNAVQDSTGGINIGPIAAFGAKAAEEKYVGFKANTAKDVFFKAFIDNKSENDTLPLYISGSDSSENEYTRPIHILADKEIKLCFSDSNYFTFTPDGITKEGTFTLGNFINIDEEGKYFIAADNVVADKVTIVDGDNQKTIDAEWIKKAELAMNLTEALGITAETTDIIAAVKNALGLSQEGN